MPPRMCDVGEWQYGAIQEVCRPCYEASGYGAEYGVIELMNPYRNECARCGEDVLLEVQLVVPLHDASDGGRTDGPGVCHGCSCDDEHACEGGCHWVEPGLCSACAEDMVLVLFTCTRCGQGCYDARFGSGECVCLLCVEKEVDAARAEVDALRLQRDVALVLLREHEGAVEEWARQLDGNVDACLL